MDVAIDFHADETITLSEQNPDFARYTEPDAEPLERLTSNAGSLSVAQIAAEAQTYLREHPKS